MTIKVDLQPNEKQEEIFGKLPESQRMGAYIDNLSHLQSTAYFLINPNGKRSVKKPRIVISYTGSLPKVKIAIRKAGEYSNSKRTLEESQEISEKIGNGGGLVYLTTNDIPLQLLGMFSDGNYVPHESFKDRQKRGEPSLGQLEEYVTRKEKEGVLFPQDTEDDEDPIQFPKRGVLGRTQEAELFLQYNYSRYKYQTALEALVRNYQTKGQIEETLSLKRAADSIERAIFNQNFPLAVSMSKEIRIPTQSPLDVISDASEALLRAIKQFDISRGYKFSTYACRAIISNFRRTNANVTREHSRCTNITDMGRENLGDIYIDNNGRERETNTTREEIRYIIEHAGLDEREKIVIQNMFFSEQTQTLDQVGRKISLSQERTRQIKTMALEKIREALKLQDLPARIRKA